MLKIRKEQFEMFEELKKTKFIEMMAVQLEINYPQKTNELSSKDLSLLINETLKKLENINIVRECDMERYLYLMFTFSFDIDSDADYLWVQDILFDEALSGDLKMSLLYQVGEQKLNG